MHKSYYVDFVTPGAYIGGHLDGSYVRAFACGNIGWQPVTNERSRQVSLYKRIATIKILEDIVLEVSPLRRSCSILNQLSAWLGKEALQQIPIELIAKMAAVHPEKIAIATKLRSSPKHRHLVAKLTRKPPISKIHRITFADTFNTQYKD